jgi:NIMA (never in mitosis gene a)-related kinase
MGVHYMHERCILHRDIKAMNIFLRFQNQIKIGDLGLAKQYTRKAEELSIRLANSTVENFEIEATRQVGTPYYLAPELFSPEGKYSPKSDIWAVGVILYELVCQHKPFSGKDFDELKEKVLNESF